MILETLQTILLLNVAIGDIYIALDRRETRVNEKKTK
jgi:hypothetical protein